uniref:Uncharacterized protein n=1 Tax=Cannabis sativa TaxID=3483 RepID=A0A803PK88_CANSA
MIKGVNTCKRMINACTVRASGRLTGVMVETTGVVGTDHFDAAETAWASRDEINVNSLGTKEEVCSEYACREGEEEESGSILCVVKCISLGHLIGDLNSNTNPDSKLDLFSCLPEVDNVDLVISAIEDITLHLIIRVLGDKDHSSFQKSTFKQVTIAFETVDLDFEIMTSKPQKSKAPQDHNVTFKAELIESKVRSIEDYVGNTLRTCGIKYKRECRVRSVAVSEFSCYPPERFTCEASKETSGKASTSGQG